LRPRAGAERRRRGRIPGRKGPAGLPFPGILLSLLLAGFPPDLPAGPGGPEEGPVLLTAENRALLERKETALATIPFPRGKVRERDLAELVVRGRPTSWRILCRWPGGSLRAAQAQFPLRLGPGQAVRLRLARGKALAGPFRPYPLSPPAPPFGITSFVADRFGVTYRASVPGGEEVLLEETPQVRVRRYHTYHRNPDPGAGIGRDFLSLTVYLTEFSSTPVVLLDVILGNDYLGSDHPGSSKDPNLHPLGDVALSEFRLEGRGLDLLPLFPSECGLEGPRKEKDGRTAWVLLKDTYLGDGQCRRWRFAGIPSRDRIPGKDRRLAESTWKALARAPLLPLASGKAWKESGALSLYGGPAYPPRNWAARAAGEFRSWKTRPWFGPFGSWGDVKETATTGTPRNTPCSPEWVHAVQTNRSFLLLPLLGKAWQQACRPYHLWGLRVGKDQDLRLWGGLPLRPSWAGIVPADSETLGRRRLYATMPYRKWARGAEYGRDRPHGWNAYDNEHWTTDLLFDAWLATGDWWCRDELRLLGECAMGMLRPFRYSTRRPQAARCEGWVAQSLVQVWLATGDGRIEDFLCDRIRRILVPAIRRDRPWKTPFLQSDYAGTGFPMPHRFYMPWQHGPLVLGMLAAWDHFGERGALELCEAAMDALEYARVRNVRLPGGRFVREGIRYYVPVEVKGKAVPADCFDADPRIGIKLASSPLGGPNEFLTLPLYLAAREERLSPRARKIAAGLGSLLLGAHRRGPEGQWNKWTFLIPGGPSPR